MRPFQVLEVKAQCVVGFPSGWPTRSGGEGLKSSGEIAWGYISASSYRGRFQPVGNRAAAILWTGEVPTYWM